MREDPRKLELREYIKNRRYHCSLCKELQRQVIIYGITRIEEWKGMICSSIEDMIIRYDKIKG